jgi:hypothetical protein
MIETLTKSAMGFLLLATVPFDGDPTAWGQWGLAGLIIGYTLWRDWQREKRMSEALEKHQTWTQQTLLSALNRNTSALERILARTETRGDHGGDH